jgi:AcrR family transcriptional regulator
MEKRSAFHHGDLRNALLDGTAKLLSASGTGGFSLREAARRAGVSANAAYRHFENKEDLLAALAKRCFARMAGKMEARMERVGDDPVGQLRATGEAYLKYAAEEPALFELMFGPHGAGSGRDVKGTGPKTGLTPFELLALSLDRLVEAGRMPKAMRRNAETVFWSSIHGLAVLANSGITPKRDRGKAFDRLFEVLLVGYRVRAERSRARGEKTNMSRAAEKAKSTDRRGGALL